MTILTKGTTLKHYKRREIQEKIVEHAQCKEIAVRYENSFGKRPDILTFPQEIIELAKRGVTSFHSSEERWSNPLTLDSNLSRKDLDQLRTGWDLVLDIDCAVFEYSRICADLVIRFLRYCGVKDISCKFSGNKGFHIGVPYEAFPKKVGEKFINQLFPEAPKKIAIFIQEKIKDELGKRILSFEKNDFSKIIERVNLSREEIVRYEDNEFQQKVTKLDVEKFLEIDTVLISSRHLYRMPYSLHEKSGLVSMPLDPSLVIRYEKNMARPDIISPSTFSFLDRNVTGESARNLLLRALDFEVKIEPTKEDYQTSKKEYEELVIESPIKEELFPPCMKLILNGLEDGKKRGIFCLMNFLGKIGWNKQQIHDFLKKWNKDNNPEPLREVYINAQLNSFNPGARLPPNCNNEAYYLGISICKPDGLCKRIKNPANYTILKWKDYLQQKEEQDKKDQKEARKEELRLKREEKEKKQIEEFKEKNQEKLNKTIGDNENELELQ